MQSHLFRSILVPLLVVAGVLVLAFASTVSGTLVLTINTPALGVFAGGSITGSASDITTDIVEVRMYIDGVLAAEDVTLTNGHNNFDFAIPTDAEGKELKIVATNDKGDIIVKKYTVRRGR